MEGFSVFKKEFIGGSAFFHLLSCAVIEGG